MLTWSADANWSGGAPTSGETGGPFLVFPAGVADSLKATVDDLPALAVSRVTFNDSGYSVSGLGTNSLALSGGGQAALVDSVGGNRFANSLTVALEQGSQNLEVDAGQDEIAGVIGGAGQLAKNGVGTLTLSGTNTYTGSTTIWSGTLRLGADNALPGNGDVSISQSTALDLNGFSATLGTLTADRGAVIRGSGTLAVNAGSLDQATVSGTLTKVGSGTLFCREECSTGSTAVQGGILDVEGGLDSSSMTVAPGGTLRGSGGMSSATVTTVAGKVDPSVLRPWPPTHSSLLVDAPRTRPGMTSKV
jgi:autotransporter-associated beta strand protein